MKQSKIEYIVHLMSDELLTNIEHFTIDASLYTGSMGIAVYYTHLYKYKTNPTYQHKVYDLVSQSLNSLNSLQGKSSLSGYAGILWGLVYLTKLDLLSYTEIKIYIDELKELVIKSIKIDVVDQNFDLMHGLIGKLLTLITLYEDYPQYNSELPPVIDKGILNLTDMGITGQVSSTLYWQSTFRSNDIF